MKLNLQIEFDTWEEYMEFSSKLFSISGQNPTETVLPPTPAKKQVKISKQSDKTQALEATILHDIVQIPGFKVPADMFQKVNEYIEANQPFRTSDVANERIMNNPHRRSKANKWLQKHPRLIFTYQAIPGKGGRGPLIYTPLQMKDGKIILPSGQPRKTDWPIRGAGFQRSYAPLPQAEEEELLELQQEPN